MKKGEKTETVLDWGLWIGWLYFASIVLWQLLPDSHVCVPMHAVNPWLVLWISMMDTTPLFFTGDKRFYSKCQTGMNYQISYVSKAIALIDLQSYYSLNALCSCLGDPFYNTGLKGITYSSTLQITSHIECTGQTIRALRGDSSFQRNSPGVLTLQWKGSQIHSYIKGAL